MKLRLRHLKIYLLSKCKNEDKEVLSNTFQADRYRLDLSLTLLTRLYEKITYFRSNFKHARSNFKDGTEVFLGKWRPLSQSISGLCNLIGAIEVYHQLPIVNENAGNLISVVQFLINSNV